MSRVSCNYHEFFGMTRRPSHVHSWPTSSPQHQLPPRFSRRSELRFTPAKTLPERWVTRSLLQAHALLKGGHTDAALAFCAEQVLVPRGSTVDFLHAAVSLFTRHGSFDAALALSTRMQGAGFALQNRTFMVLLRGAHRERGEFLAQLCEAMARGGVRMDDLSLKSVLDTMVKHGYAPAEVEDALENYRKGQGKEWVPTLGMFHTLIQAWSLAGSVDRAEHWLEKYRDAYRSAGKGPPGSYLFGRTDNKTHVLPKKPEPAVMKSHSASDNPQKIYAAVIMGMGSSRQPAPERLQKVLAAMQQDGVPLNTEMHNMIVRALFQWGMPAHAFRMFEELLKPGSPLVPDVYSFHRIFMVLNPKHPRRRSWQISSRRVLHQIISTRHVFSEMIRISRLRLRARSPVPDKNLISTASFNRALRTFCAQADYAAAWTVLALFTWFHIVPDAKTSRIVVHSLLSRLRAEMSSARSVTDVLWMDRFLSETRLSMMAGSQRMMLADHLYLVGRVSVDNMWEQKFQWYLRPTSAFGGNAKVELEFVIALLRSALQAELGYQTLTDRASEAEELIGNVMKQARTDMVPRGRFERSSP